MDRGADCFERGPVPFADFLYHENRRLELEHPRMIVEKATGSAMTSADGIASQEQANETRTSERSDGPEAPARERGVAPKGAVVVNLSRPTLVARFIDLYV